ncbi:MAG: MFS transporter [Sandaracinus sp.]|nr:MFS transporter [Sandaracinus sp.]
MASAPPSPRRSLAAALLGFFIITLDALVVSVALPAIRGELGGGITGLQWVMDGYTLPFAAFLLLAGTVADRIGSRRVFGIGLAVFTLSSVACAVAPTLGWLVAARVVQGAGAAAMTPASLALIGEAYPDPIAKARAVGIWAVGGAVASASGPLVGGALTAWSWKLIFLVNVPVGLVTTWLLAGVQRSPRRPAPFDGTSQVAALLALGGLTFALIEAGEAGLSAPRVRGAFALALVGALTFALSERRATTPMVPLRLLRERRSATPIAIGFTFMVGFYGMVFAMSLLLQEVRGLSPLETGLAFLPVTGLSVFAPPLAARLGGRTGPWVPIVLGQVLMAVGLVGLALGLDATLPVLVVLMMLVSLGSGTAMPSATSLLLNAAPADLAGTASGVLNTSRQLGGALAIAAFGALIAALGYDHGVRISLGLGGAALALTALASLRLRRDAPSDPGASTTESAPGR